MFYWFAEKSPVGKAKETFCDDEQLSLKLVEINIDGGRSKLARSDTGTRASAYRQRGFPRTLKQRGCSHPERIFIAMVSNNG